MLVVPGDRGPTTFCDGLSRRSFLKIGGLALGGVSLPQLLEAQSASGGVSEKALIMIYLTGGPPHQDMVDLKPDAPKEIRGDFSPIKTNVPGIEISELMPRTARRMDKFAIIRSVVGAAAGHSSYQCVTGRTRGTAPQGGWPEIGSVLSKLHGRNDPAVAPAIDLSKKMQHVPYNLPGPGFLGAAHTPFKPSDQAMADMVLNVSPGRLNQRKTLISSLDRFRSDVQRAGAVDDLNPYTKQALEVLTSSRLVEALDLNREDPRVREQYGVDDPKVLSYSNLGYQALMSKFLQARRCVEAGARCVTVAFADFDWHGGNFSNARKVVPLLDQGVSALVEDLHQRGLDKDVTVVVWGEFGRTPRINKSAGRDHWPKVSFAMLAGGGMRTGQVIGRTNRLGEYPVDRPVHFQEVLATAYHNLGVDPATTTVSDLSGRPHYLVDPGYLPISELI